MIVVFSRPGREAITSATLAALHTHGGADQVARKALFWVGETLPPELPSAWELMHLLRPPAGSVTDFWALLAAFPDEDLCVFEDDVYPCRNAVVYIERWNDPRFTSFFNPRCYALGPRPLPVGVGWDCSQAIKVPRAVAAQLVAADTTRLGPDHDTAIVEALRGGQMFMHRSLVRHVGKLRAATGKPSPVPGASDYVGDDFDALQEGQAAAQ